MEDLTDKRVLVTGGTHGIGRAMVLAFARAGATVVACHRNENEAAAKLAVDLEETGAGRHKLVTADVTDSADVERLAAACREHLGGLDVVVNNVGVDAHAPLDHLDDAEWHRVMDHNVTSAYLVTKATLTDLVDGGSVINIGSSAAQRGRPNGAHYTASKAALQGLTRALCKELGPRGIRVNLIAPGVVRTEDDRPLPPPVADRLVAMTALGRLAAPEDIVGTALFLAGDSARYVTGAVINVDGGM